MLLLLLILATGDTSFHSLSLGFILALHLIYSVGQKWPWSCSICTAGCSHLSFRWGTTRGHREWGCLLGTLKVNLSFKMLKIYYQQKVFFRETLHLLSLCTAWKDDKWKTSLRCRGQTDTINPRMLKSFVSCQVSKESPLSTHTILLLFPLPKWEASFESSKSTQEMDSRGKGKERAQGVIQCNCGLKQQCGWGPCIHRFQNLRQGFAPLCCDFRLLKDRSALFPKVRDASEWPAKPSTIQDSETSKGQFTGPSGYW